MDPRRTFGSALRRIRQQRGYSQEELAARSGLHRTYVGAVERGERNISLLNIWKLAAALECTPADLLGSTAADSPEETDGSTR
jgi:transcriptional regulator with XRE-family HTH domain